jgi:hypothetical protein
MAHTVSFQNTEEEARAALKPINDSRPPGAIVEVEFAPTSLLNEYISQDAANPHDHRYCSDNAYVNNDVDVAAVLEEAFTTLPSKQSMALWFAMNPCSRRPLPDMALSMQTDHYFALYTIWEDEKDDSRCKIWVRDVMEHVKTSSAGAYLGDSDFQVRKTMFWGEAQGKKLMDMRRKYDPTGTICGYLDEGDRSGVDGLENEL